jgi:small subunit ribosomal protein S9
LTPEDKKPEPEPASDAPSEGASAESAAGPETDPVSEGESPRAAASPDVPSEEKADEPEAEEPAAPEEAPAAEETAEPVAEEPAAEEPVAEEPAAAEPVAEEPAAEEPAADEPAAEETPEPAAEPVAAADEPTRVQEPTPTEAGETPGGEAAEATGDAAPGSGSEDEFDATPRVKPEIPGADLEPVFVPQEEQYLDAEAQAAAEAEAEAEAERRRAEAEDEAAKPIADAAIDLAAGARYTATGKRKTAVARVILRPGAGTYSINGKQLEEFFPRDTLQRMIRQPLETVGYEARMDVVARMHGGGVAAQAGALRHGISRALIVADPNLRSELKRRGFLTRDPRVKERKKAGLKKARKRPQFSKR